MEKISIFENFIKIKFVRYNLCDSRTCTVVNNAGWADGSTVLQKIDTEAVSTTCDIVTINT